MAFLDLILLAAIAGFLGYRLWTILGTHDVDKPIRKRKSTEEDLVVPIRTKASSAEEIPEAEADQAKDLKEDHFLQGAQIAFHRIVEAYAEGNLQSLKNLLEGPLLDTFAEAIQKREKSKKKLEVDISRIISVDILEDREEKEVAYVTVKFVSEQCLVTRNAKGKVIEGDPDRYVNVTDIWTFARSLKSSNPNWKLVATQVEEA